MIYESMFEIIYKKFSCFSSFLLKEKIVIYFTSNDPNLVYGVGFVTTQIF